MRNIFLFICALMLFGCKEAKRTLNVEPEKMVEIPQEIQTSFFDNVSEYGLLPLEATDESLIMVIEKLKIYDGKIFVLDGRSNKNLYVFDMEGKFLRTISRRGRGPREHVDLHNFEIDPTRKEILLLDRDGRKILIYDLDGEYRNTVKLTSGPECAGRLPNGNFVLAYVGSQLRMNENHVLAICDSNGEVLSRHIENAISVSIQISAKDILVTMEDGSMSLMPQFNNIIYHIDDKGIVPALGIKFGDKTVELYDFDKDFDSVMEYLNFLGGKNYIFGDHVENNHYIFFNNKGAMDMEHIFIDKKSGELLRAKNALWGASLTLDKDGYFWGSLNEARLKRNTENNEFTEEIKRHYENYDNPSLIYYKLKV